MDFVKTLLMIGFLGFLTIWLATGIFANVEKPTSINIFNNNNELESPSDWIKENQIHVYKDRIVIDAERIIWSKFTDTNSMDPLFDKGSNGLEMIPSDTDEIGVGDIISYRSKYSNGIIIHRVIEKGEDEKGIYFIAKGDNNDTADPGKIRFDQIEGVLIGILY